MIFDWKTEMHRYRRYFVDIQKIYKRKEVRTFGELTLSLLTISFFAFFAIKPTLVIIAKLTKEIKDKEEIQIRLRKKIADLLKAQENYSLTQNRFYLIDQALPLSPDFSSLIFPLEKEAYNSGLNVESFSISKIEIIRTAKVKTPTDEALDFEFNLTLTGNYSDLQNFLRRVDQLRRIINLEKINFKSVKKAKESDQTTMLSISGVSKFYTANDNQAGLETKTTKNQ